MASSSPQSTVAIIGAGPLGRWLAQRAALAGYIVLLEDVMPWNLTHAQEKLRQQLGPEHLPNVTFTSTMEDAVHNADLVIDCVPDELESKLEVLWLLDRMAPPRAIFATPSPALSIDDLAHCTYREDRCIAIAAEAKQLAGYPELPAGPQTDEGPALTLYRAKATSEATVEFVTAFWRKIGFNPSVVANPRTDTAF